MKKTTCGECRRWNDNAVGLENYVADHGICDVPIPPWMDGPRVGREDMYVFRVGDREYPFIPRDSRMAEECLCFRYKIDAGDIGRVLNVLDRIDSEGK